MLQFLSSALQKTTWNNPSMGLSIFTFRSWRFEADSENYSAYPSRAGSIVFSSSAEGFTHEGLHPRLI
jgi:hypothetical protein